MLPEFVTFLDTGKLESSQLIKKICLFIQAELETSRGLVLRLSSEKSAQTWDRELWTFKDTAFVPHTIYRPGINLSSVAVILAWEELKAQDAGVGTVISTAPADLSELSTYSRVFELLRRDSQSSLMQCRDRWSQWKALGIKPCHLTDW